MRENSIELLMKLAPSLLFSLLLGTFATPSVLAQVTPDGTTSTTVTPTATGVEINNGDTAGGNLFHSFGEFSVPTGSEAFFNNASDISNIFSRVTGGNISNIDGILRANGTANLFLINPAGIVFGEGARLQLGGSFYGSTADSILFPDGEFSATDLDNPPLITINAPIGLNFRDDPATITVRGNGNGVRFSDSEIIDTQEALRVDGNATIGFIAGGLIFEDATVKTAGGNIELGSVAGGVVDLVETANGFSFAYSAVESFQDISLTGVSTIDASGEGSGAINVAGNNISLNEVSGILSNTLGATPGQDINIVAAESLNISGVDNEFNTSSGIANSVFPEATADGGNINITTGSLTMSDRAALATSVSGQGNAGKITIDATESVTLNSQNSFATISTGITEGAVGNGGVVEINADSLTFENAATINTITSGDGNAGDVVINTIGDISFRGQGNQNGIFTDSFSPTVGQSGNIELNGRNISLDNSSLNNLSDRAVGEIIINATGNIALTNDSGIFAVGTDLGSIDITAKNLEITTSDVFGGISEDFSSEASQTGDISINLSEDLTLRDQARITQGNFGIGDAGDIAINARNINLTNNSQIINPHVGQGSIGDLILNATGDITLLNGGQVTTNTSGQGNIGSITLNAAGDITLDTDDSSFGRSIVNQFVNTGATGEVGRISVKSQNLILRNGGVISSLVVGVADSGAIDIDVAETIIVDGSAPVTLSDGSVSFLPSQINSEIASEGQGNSGNITIETTNLSLSRNGNISTSTFGDGNAGNITIDASEITMSEQGRTDIPSTQISSAASSGIVDPSLEANSGNITIKTDSLDMTDGGRIDVSTGSIGEGGNIDITAKNITLSNRAIFITSNFGQGDAGNITVDVAENFTARNGLVFSNIGSGALDTFTVGNVGNITIDANKIELSETAQIQAVAFATATTVEPGIVSLSATESISFTGDDTGIFVDNEPGSFGNASNTRLIAPEITLDNEALVSASNQSDGQGGNIIIETDRLSLNQDSFLQSNVSGTGNAGSIEINARDWMRMTNSSSIEAAVLTNAAGNGGNVNIETGELTLSEGSLISAQIAENAVGNGGDIFINGETVTLTDGSQISVLTSGKGNAGTLNINASESIALKGTLPQSRGGFLANALIGDGRGGDIFVSTEELTLADGATITVSNFSSLGFTEPGTGEAGNLIVDVNSLTIEDGAVIDAATQSGNGGNITFNIAENLVLRNNGTISARALQDANGGNINLDAEFILAYPNQNNDIIASAERGQGGNININAEAIFGIEERALNPRTNDINASSQFGLDGRVSINTPDTNPLQDTTELTFEIVTNNVAISNSCRAATIDNASGLVVRGKGGVPPEPTEPFEGQAIITEEDIKSQPETEETETTNNYNPGYIPPHIKPVTHDENGEPIYIARGLIVKPDGSFILTAYPTPGTPGYREYQQQLGCDVRRPSFQSRESSNLK